MTHHRHLLPWTAFALASALLTAPAGAQTTTAAAPATGASQPLSKGELKAIREFQMLDFNGDGKLSRAEIAIVPRLAAAFDDADTNHDNYVTLEEVRAFTLKYRAERDKARAASNKKATGEAEAPAPTKP